MSPWLHSWHHYNKRPLIADTYLEQEEAISSPPFPSRVTLCPPHISNMAASRQITMCSSAFKKITNSYTVFFFRMSKLLACVARHVSIHCHAVLNGASLSILTELRQEEFLGVEVVRGCRQNVAGINGEGVAAQCNAGFSYIYIDLV